MSKLKKLLLILIATPILLIVIAVVGVYLYANSIAKSQIQTQATRALGVTTTLGSASVGILSGKFGISGLKVANPQGYTPDKFMSLDDGKVAITLSSLMKDTIVVPTFSLDTIEVNLQKKDGKANYQVIMDNLAKLSKGGEPSKPAEGGGKKFIINDLTIRHVVVKADLSGMTGPVGQVLHGGGNVTIPIEEIRLQNVGKDTGSGMGGSGVTVAQLTSLVVQAVMAAAAENGKGILPADILGEIKGGLNQIGGLAGVGVQVIGKAGEAAQQIGGALQGAAQEGVKQLEKAGEGLGDKLKEVLPGKKK